MNGWYEEYAYTCNGQPVTDGKIVLTGLAPGTSGTMELNVSLSDVVYTTSTTYWTSNITPSIKATVTASSVAIEGTYIQGDAVVDAWNLKIDGKTVPGQTAYMKGLPPNTSYEVEYTIYVKYDQNGWTYKRAPYTQKTTVTTANINLVPSQPKVISPGNVIVAATANVDEEESNVGFEWRRIDWTDDFASNSGIAVLYSNTMEGYIRNLNTNYLWKFRAFYQSDDGKKYYGDWLGIDPENTAYFEPTIHTYSKISVEGNGAQLKGYALGGTDKVKVQGFKYWKTAVGANSQEGAPRKVASVPGNAMTEEVPISGSGQQVMTANLKGLDFNATYHYVAFVTTVEGDTFYGEEQVFTTGEDPTGIDEVNVGTSVQEPATVVARYNMSGQPIATSQKGINILRMSDGTVKKVLVK